ncbi:MAG: hypothetical protein EOP33_01005 [Rickettsiaceae bacterium]|nr:MAG: hypothetical protein EOP33_01005 [Rickettsiaceae bacterium]
MTEITKKLISEEKIYELALNEKKHYEDSRDQINGQYIGLFAAIIAVTPFINNMVEAVPGKYEGLVIRVALTMLSLIGLILSFLWLANLKRILFLLEALDKIVINLEKEYDIAFKLDLFKELEKKGAPDRITKYQILMPRMFILIFTGIIIYSLAWIIAI